MKFGPEIKVDGKRPEWLEDNDEIDIRWSEGSWFSAEDCGPVAVKHIHWGGSTGIRLPANHPHYTTPTPDERVMAPELVERMRAFVQKCHDLTDYEKINTSMPFVGLAVTDEERFLCTEARAILAALEPVDGDLIEARKVFAGWCLEDGDKRRALQINAGEYDKAPTLDMIKTALARGRQLEKEGK